MRSGRRAVPGGRDASAVVARGGCEQHREDRAEIQDRVGYAPHTRGVLDLHGPPPVRQPGYLREARGFASPPRDGFAVVGRSLPGMALTDGTSLGVARVPAPEANPGHAPVGTNGGREGLTAVTVVGILPIS